MNIDIVLKGAHTYASAIYGNLQTKNTVNEGILRLVALSCQRYHKDVEFRNQIDNLEMHLRPKGE